MKSVAFVQRLDGTSNLCRKTYRSLPISEDDAYINIQEETMHTYYFMEFAVKVFIPWCLAIYSPVVGKTEKTEAKWSQLQPAAALL